MQRTSSKLAIGTLILTSLGVTQAENVSVEAQPLEHEALTLISQGTPIFPEAARRKGIGGFCTVEYTVTSEGTVAAARVITDECSDPIFYPSSLKMVRSYRYAPLVLHGEAVDAPGIRTRFKYRYDRDFAPLRKVKPAYPAAAVANRIEGRCVVEFTVTREGDVDDIRVIEDECDSKLFQAPSIEAVEQLKYEPRVIDGRAVDVFGVRVTMHYRYGG